MYKFFLKRLFDVLLSGFALIVLALPMLLLAVVIRCDSKGPVLFRQKRVGKGKKTFMILKFRTMRVDTPHDAPTHELADPKRYITRVGGFLRKTSLDELPQILNIFLGQMSIIGPRPALWNQDDLVAERDKYGANDIRPGLSGWAQVNGRDELPIPVKARLDGDYTRELNAGFLRGLGMDISCFFKTIFSVLRSEGVVEGGTGQTAAVSESAEAEKTLAAVGSTEDANE